MVTFAAKQPATEKRPTTDELLERFVVAGFEVSVLPRRETKCPCDKCKKLAVVATAIGEGSGIMWMATGTSAANALANLVQNMGSHGAKV